MRPTPSQASHLLQGASQASPGWDFQSGRVGSESGAGHVVRSRGDYFRTGLRGTLPFLSRVLMVGGALGLVNHREGKRGCLYFFFLSKGHYLGVTWDARSQLASASGPLAFSAWGCCCRWIVIDRLGLEGKRKAQFASSGRWPTTVGLKTGGEGGWVV